MNVPSPAGCITDSHRHFGCRVSLSRTSLIHGSEMDDMGEEEKLPMSQPPNYGILVIQLWEVADLMSFTLNPLMSLGTDFH